MKIFFDRFVGNYGLTGLMDYLHGTDKGFRETENFKKSKVWIPFIKPRHDDNKMTQITVRENQSLFEK